MSLQTERGGDREHTTALTHHRRINEHAVEVIPASGYKGKPWYAARRRAVSASEIAAVLGLPSAYGSPFDLWWRKRESDDKPSNRAMSRGSRVEPLVLEDWEEAHPEFQIGHVGLVQNIDRPWQVATPDGLAYERRSSTGFLMAPWVAAEPLAVVEAKTAGGSHGWGERGTDQVPPEYRAQVIWQMDTLGLTVAYLPVWVGFDYREYVVEYDAEDAEFMREAASDFLDSIEADVPPPIDGHPATTERLKRMHPTVKDEAVVVPEALVRQYATAKRLQEATAARVRLHENRLRALVGDAQRGVLMDGRKVVSRSVYDVAPRVQKVDGFTVSKITVTAPEKAKPPKPKPKPKTRKKS